MLLRQGRLYSPDDSGGAGTGNDSDGGAGTGDDDAGGGADGGGEGGGEGGDDKPVKRSDHQRALDDLNRFKRKAADEAKERQRLAARLDELERKGKGEDIEALKADLETVRGEKEQLRASVIKSEKNRAILPALMEAGLRPDAKKILEHLNTEDLEVEISTHGNITVHGVDDFVKKVKREYAFAFESKKATKVNGGGGGSNDGGGKQEWTPGALVDLERQCKKKGDMKPYNAAVAEYLEQKKNKK